MWICIFFFQAEDGRRDVAVTGVQTCALPISAKSEDPKGGEGKVDANLTNFLSTDAAGGTPTRPPRPGEAPHPAPSARKSATQTAQKTALRAPCEHPGGFGIRKSASNSGHSPLRGSGG